jgi:hypothetical protein
VDTEIIEGGWTGAGRLQPAGEWVWDAEAKLNLDLVNFKTTFLLCACTQILTLKKRL